MSENIIGKTLLNQFRVDTFVASGGMGAVYKVWDLKRNVPLAMKVLHSDLAEDPSVLKRFEREARALQKLSHPHIVPFYGLKQAEGFSFLLEKYIDGPTLKDILKGKRGPLPLDEALGYFTAVCAALGFAHHNGVVHCDIKPGNVMVDRGGNIYLTDFGIARHADSVVTTFGGAGTPAYMAPEQILEKPVSAATDVYALGIMLYEMLAGVRPFRGDEPESKSKGETSGERIRYAQLNVDPPDPRSLNSSIPGELAVVIKKALAKSSADRYQNATEMLEAVQKILLATEGRSVETGASGTLVSDDVQGFPKNLVTTFTQYWTAISSNRAVWVSGTVVLLMIFSGLAFARNANSPSPNEVPTLTRKAPINSEPVAATKTPIRKTPTKPASTTAAEVSTTSGGQWIAYSYGADQDSTGADPRYLEMINVQTGKKRQLTFDNGGVNFPSFSPRGDQIIYTGCKSGLCELYILDIDSGNIEKLAGIAMKAMWPSWCSDGARDLIAFEGRSTAGNRSIYVYDISAKKASRVSDGSFDLRPSWSSDCSRIVFLRDIGGQDDIYVHDMSEDRDYAVIKSTFDEFNASFSPDGRKIIFTRVSQDTNGDGHQTLDDDSNLFIMNADGSDVTPLTNNQYGIFSPSFSPDGKKIAFVAFTGSSRNQQIIIYSLEDGSFNTVASNGPYNHTDWSP